MAKKFTKWIKLPSELRLHPLSYCHTRELGQYAQFSKLCNEEIQQFNIIAPKYLSVAESSNGNILICAKYSITHEFYLDFAPASEDTHKLVRTSTGLGDWRGRFENDPILEGSAWQAAFKYLEKLLKYTTNTKIGELHVNCGEWPHEELRRIPAIYKVSYWNVQMYSTMCDAFINFMYETTNVKKLELNADLVNRNLITLPSEFFNSTFFKQLEHANFDVKGEIANDDFLASNAKYLHLQCDSISETAINQKFRQWFETDIDLRFKFTFDGFRRWNYTVLFQNLPFERRSAIGPRYLIRQDGKVGVARIRYGQFEFSVQ